MAETFGIACHELVSLDFRFGSRLCKNIYRAVILLGYDSPVLWREGLMKRFVDELDLGGLGFDRVAPQATGRPGYHPSVLLKLYIYGYLNRVQSSRRLEREAGRNVEVMWLSLSKYEGLWSVSPFMRSLV